MKRKILIICLLLATVGITAFGYLNQNDQIIEEDDRVYKVESRFNTTITKTDVLNATTVVDLIPDFVRPKIREVYTTEVSIVDQKINHGTGNKLTPPQLTLLQTFDYSTYYQARLHCTYLNHDGVVEDVFMRHNMTVVPEKQAEYSEGQDALIKYLKETCRKETAHLNQKELEPAQVSFNVTASGTIEQVKLISTSGFNAVDKLLIEIVQKTPGNWKPATNAEGTPVGQEFVFFFGVDMC